MRTTLIAVGRLRPAWRVLGDEYLRRLRRYGAIEERELREAPAGHPTAVRTRIEGERILGAVPPGALLVALDRSGTAWSSPELARRVERWRTGPRPLALAIGGAGGLAPAVLASASAVWSLGPLTLPHELARVLVLEQWYRAWTILRGEPYHK